MSETPRTNAASPEAAMAVLEMITGGWVAQIVRATADLRIPDHVASGAQTAEEVADLAGSDPHATFRLMRAASSLGLLSYEGDRRFGLTKTGQLLRCDVPGSLRAVALMQTAEAHWQCWSRFPDAVKRGRGQAQEALGMDLFTYFAQDANKAEAELFARAMGELSGLVIDGALVALDTSTVSTVVDVGGADGDFVLALLQANPSLHGQVIDLPHAVEGARREAARRGLSERFWAVAGDFFDSVPEADLYLLKLILHDWDNDRCVQILRNCRSAARPDGRAVIVERVIGELGQRDSATLADMNMLSVTEGGMERDLDEYDALFTASGWRRIGDATPVGGNYYMLTAQTAE